MLFIKHFQHQTHEMCVKSRENYTIILMAFPLLSAFNISLSSVQCGWLPCIYDVRMVRMMLMICWVQLSTSLQFIPFPFIYGCPFIYVHIYMELVYIFQFLFVILWHIDQSSFINHIYLGMWMVWKRCETVSRSVGHKSWLLKLKWSHYTSPQMTAIIMDYTIIEISFVI